MKQCPVCGAAYAGTEDTCGNCGFAPGWGVFLNTAQLMHWQKNVLEPERVWQRGTPAVFACGGMLTGYCEAGRLRTEPSLPYQKAARWRDVTAAAAGNSHIAGLLADGTVRAAGKNHMGQCDTAAWTDVVQICAAGDTTAGITAAGTLLACGEGAEALEDIAGALNGRGLHIRSAALNRSCAVFAALQPGGGTLVHYAPYREDDGSERSTERTYAGAVQIAAGWAGCFVLHGGVTEALNTAAVHADSGRLAAAVNRLSAGNAERLAVGRETLYAYRRSGALWFCNTARESGTHPLPEDAVSLLAVSEQADGSLLLAVQTPAGIRKFGMRNDRI